MPNDWMRCSMFFCTASGVTGLMGDAKRLANGQKDIFGSPTSVTLPFSMTSHVIPAASITCRSCMIVYCMRKDIWVFQSQMVFGEENLLYPRLQNPIPFYFSFNSALNNSICFKPFYMPADGLLGKPGEFCKFSLSYIGIL